MRPILIERNKRDPVLGKGGKLISEGYQGFLEKQHKKEQKRLDIRKKFTCKKAVYENARMLDPSGNLLCHTEFKKANWYVSKNLATVVHQSEGQLTVKLNFEPNKTST